MEEFLSGKNILVTGGAGFIGSNLVESFLFYGNKVVCLDNFSTGKRENIAPFLDNPDFELIEGDIRDYETCFRSLAGVDIVFHEAALGSVPRSINDPITSTDVNIGGFVKMLFAAKEAGVKRFVYAASSSTYGDHPGLPKVEDKIGKPLSPYAITKYVDELFAENFSKLYGIDVIGLRYFNVFGRRQDPEGAYAAVIPLFIKLLKEHKVPVINGDGTYSRDFSYIDSIVRANNLAALVEDKNAINQVYNIAHGEVTTLNELFYIIRHRVAAHDPSVLEIEPEHGPFRIGDIPHSLASIEKAGNLLKYAPVCGVKEGLNRTVDWYFS
jgi:UDP-N-acetylglucosamine 4-epimerase